MAQLRNHVRFFPKGCCLAFEVIRTPIAAEEKLVLSI
jgi:hypothetical protein